MGGTNEIKIHGLRAHASSGKVHLHDDENGIKFEKDSRQFTADLTDAAKELKSTDGAVAIEGDSNVKLVVGRHGSETFSALCVAGDTADDFLRWAQGC